jgi:glucose/arabinose dehydrogenase
MRVSKLSVLKAALACLLSLFALAVSIEDAQASTLPNGFSETLIARNLSSPSAFDIAPDGRIFVTEQGGRVRVIKNNTLLSTPFVTINVNDEGERGLLGITFDPNFESNHYVYVYYTTASSPIHNRVSRFTANGDVAAAGSETVILNLTNLSDAINHNGGAIRFGTDGKLYIGAGENQHGTNAQSLGTMLGKILRVNRDGSIPTDNPFYNATTGDNRTIWAIGIRNPFNIAFDSATGRFYINDVGQDNWEEINQGFAGANYGWPATEGPTSNSQYRTPIYYYNQNSGTPNGCAITGGVFYRPAVNQFPASYIGDYFFADYCGAWIRGYDPATDTSYSFANVSTANVVGLAVSSDGSLYYLGRGSGSNTGEVHRIQFVSSGSVPTITQSPTNVTVSAGQPATFTCSATGNPTPSFRWQRNGSTISGATSNTYRISSASAADNGATFRCVASNVMGSATSNAATLTVSTNRPPTATITSPQSGLRYNAGNTISFAGTASDPEDGPLPASAYTWEVVFHHETHTHPFISPFSGETQGTFVIPTSGETSPSVWYRIHLTVRDSDGLTYETYRDVQPNKVQITLSSSVGGLQANLDAQPVNLPYTFTSVVGMIRNLHAISPQQVGDTLWVFGSWSDGGAQNHNITASPGTTSYRINWLDVTPPSTPSLRSPNDGVTTGDNTPTLSWNSSAHAAQYTVQVDDNGNFSSPEAQATVSGTSYTPNVLPLGTYFWRVLARNAVGDVSAWTEARRFVVVTPDSAVPERNRSGGVSPRLTWNRVSWASGYWIQVDNNSNFSSPEYFNDTLDENTLAVYTTPLQNGRYYWRVRARRADGTWGSWSTAETFIVAV